MPLKFNLSVGNAVEVALLCALYSEQLVCATGDCIRNKQVLNSRRVILWPGAITSVLSLFKYDYFSFFELIMLELIELLH